MVDPFATQNPQQTQQGTDNSTNTHDQEAFGGTPNIFADMAASAFQPLDPDTGKPIPHTSETIDPFLRDTGSDTTDTTHIPLDETTTEALEDPFLDPVSHEEKDENSKNKVEEMKFTVGEDATSDNNHYDPFLDNETEIVESGNHKPESTIEIHPEIETKTETETDVGITPPTVIQGLVDGMIDQFMPSKKPEDEVASSPLDASSEEMKFTVDETEIDEGGNLKAMPTGRQVQGDKVDSGGQKLEISADNNAQDPETSAGGQKVEMKYQKSESDVKVQAVTEFVDDTTIAMQSDLVQKFHALLDAMHLVHRYRDDSSEFSVVGADNDALSTQYDFDTEDDNHIVISKHETDRKTSTQQMHVMQFALDEDGELELYVNDVLLFTEAQLQDEMKSKMQVLDKFAKFIFLVTQFGKDQEKLYTARQEQVEQEKAKGDFKDF